MFKVLRNKPMIGLIAVLAVGGVVLLGPGPDLSASNNQVSALEALCNSPVGLNRKAMAIEALCEIDTGSSRNALKRLADSTDLRTSTMAMSAIGREDFSGAKNKLKAVFESSSRSNTARAAAMTAWCCSEKNDGKAWSDVESYLENEADGNEELEAAVAATKARVFTGGGGQ